MLCYGNGGERKDGVKDDSQFSGKTNLMMAFTDNGNASGRIQKRWGVGQLRTVSYFKYVESEAPVKHLNRNTVKLYVSGT